MAALPPTPAVRMTCDAQGRQMTIVGDSHTVRVCCGDSNGEIVVIEQNNPPGIGVPMHTHQHEDETFHVLAGQMQFSTPEKTFVAGPGSTVFLPRKLPHAWLTVGDAPVKTLLIITPGRNMEPMFDELAQLPPGPPDFAVISKICERYGITFA